MKLKKAFIIFGTIQICPLKSETKANCEDYWKSFQLSNESAIIVDSSQSTFSFWEDEQTPIYPRTRETKSITSD